MKALVLALCLMAAPSEKETALPMPFSFGLSASWKTEAEKFQKQLAGIQSNAEIMSARVGQLENKIDNIQLGIANSANSGVQWFSGDVGTIALAGLFAVMLTSVIGYYRMQIKIHSSAGLILASATNDEEAREKAAVAPPKVQDIVVATIAEKNNKVG